MVLVAACIAARADLGRWIQDIAAPSRLQAVFFRSVAMPGGMVEVRRPPKETRAELTKLISAAPTDADLYALRAREDEQQLDFAEAENDWKKHVELASNKAAAGLSLADFYHRRLRPRDEIAALHSVAGASSPASEKIVPAPEQESWKIFARIQTVIADQALPADLAITEYRAWIARYQSEPAVYRTFFDYLIAHKQFAEADKIIGEFRKSFPSDPVFPIHATASLAAARGSVDEALRVYDQSFQPLWPPALVTGYFELLKQTHSLRRYLAQAHDRIAANPTDVAVAARVYYYHQQQGNLAAALRALLEYRQRKESRKSAWTADELFTLAQLFEGAHNYDEAARSYLGLYNIAGADNQERALAGLANILLTAPEQPIRFGSGDLSYYRDIATMDPGPGFLNGILSLILNSTAPQMQYAMENQASVAYFHRARAAELIGMIDDRFPSSKNRPALHARLIEAYATYGDDAGILRAGRQFLSTFPSASQRTQVATAMADAYARQQKTKEEFAIYDDLLKELAARADNVPIGQQGVKGLQPVLAGRAGEPPAPQPEYARILDRYVARLVSLKRIPDALTLYRREIDRNANDPGLYERFAAFLEQNKLGSDVEQVYRRAISQFQDRTWSEKLARWYLKRKQTAQFDQLTRDVVKIFSGTDLEAYLSDVGKGQAIAPVLYRQVNLYAHQRFPYDLTFVRNLLTAYSRKGTADPIAREALLRNNWYYADDLRDQYFELLSRTGRLKAAVNPAAVRFTAEAETWQSHFEAAAPLLREIAAEYPGDVAQNTRAASVFRSLGNTDISAALAEQVARYDPLDKAALTRIGEIYADRELFNRARPFWDRISNIDPGKPDGYIEAATVFWDYYRFDDALRVIGEGRQKLGKPELFSFEGGAIYENQRDYTRAIQEYAKGDSQSRSRLVTLARRPRQRALVDDLTAKQASAPNADIAAISLRVDILNAQDRKTDLGNFLLTAADRSNSLEVLQYIDTTAATYGFDTVEERSKTRQIAVTTDPVERIQAQLALIRYYEGRHDLTAAGRVADDVYKNNPTVLGVVRATTDFFWRNKNPKRAIDVLAQSAEKAQPAYRDPFTLEAARKATESSDYKRARTLLAPLLEQAPFRPQYVAAMADTYARQGDDRGLKDFYTARLDSIRAAQLSATEKTEKATALRRGLIPVLTRLKDYAGGTGQYIEILNRYPEDEDVAREAAAYALSHGRTQQLVAYYDKAAKDSPRDFRWPMLEARIQTQLENFPAALAAYAQAEAIRPDRVDFYTASGGLQERLLRFDDAAATYAKLYELNYHNSQWMEKVATVRARQGQADAAVKALEAALIQGQPARPETLFAVAARLESWNMLPQAREYAEKAVALAGPNLLTDYQSGAGLYARVMTRLRQHEAAFTRLSGFARNGQGLVAPLSQMGSGVRQYFTPEEKLAFASFLNGGQPKPAAQRMQALLPVVQSAGLLEVEARWRYALLIASPTQQQPSQLIELQQRRLQFDELGAQLESYWKALPPETENRDSYLDQAARNFRLAANATGELRVLALKAQQGGLAGPELDRYAELLTRSPQRLATAASSDPSDDIRNAIANYVIKSGNAGRAFDVVAARGRGLPPVWTRAYTALTGLYFAANTAPVNTAFREALDNATIGERLGKAVDRTQQLAGDVWFYYGSRFGEYLGATKQSDAEDYLPAMLEDRPGSADAYLNLAEYYRDAGQVQRALEEYRDALQFDPRRGAAHERVAIILRQQGKQDEALAEFHAALDAFARQQDERRVPESFWQEVRNTLEDIGKYKVFASVRDTADRLLRTYVRRNGDFRADELMQGALAAGGMQWVLDLSKAAPEPSLFLASIAGQEWVSEDQRPVVYRALIESAKQRVSRAQGAAQSAADSDLRRWQIDFITYLVQHKKAQDAQAVLADVPVDVLKARASEFVPLEIQIAAQSGSLQSVLDRYTSDPDLPSRLESLRNAANELEKTGNHAAARQVLAFVYTRQLDQHELTPAIFLGLAEIRLQNGDLNGAVALLRRMALVAGEPFENLTSAAALLNKSGHPEEAAEFLKQRVQAVPWDFDARMQLAQISKDVETLRAIAQSNEAPYQVRAAAATKAGPLNTTLNTASAELNALSSSPLAPAAAEKPYFYSARIEAAAATTDPAIKIRLLRTAIAIDPTSENPKIDLVRAALAAKRWPNAVAYATGLPYTDPALVRGLAEAYEQIHDLGEAQRLYELARQLDPGGAVSTRQIRRIQAQLKRQELNEQRRPVITANLEQDHVVRPRLTGAVQ